VTSREPLRTIGADIDWAGYADIPAMRAIINDARAGNTSFRGPPLSHDDFIAATQGERILLARIADEPAGFAAVWAPDGFLHHLYVAPRFQRQGIGRLLLNACLERFGQPMSLKCLESNTAAQHFYESNGWQAQDAAMGPDGPYVLYVSQPAQ
jgi:ribosomal protein S18 acetylase RimI-like enzyme